jgi:hypothetical protein
MAVTFGDASAPSQITKNLDALFATSLANYQQTLIDNIGSANPLLFKIMGSSAYQGTDGGTHIELPLMYELAGMDSYDGYDVLDDSVIDGITSAVFQWRQVATPISYSVKEAIQNARKLIDLVESKIMQAEMGIQEGWATHLLQGSGAGAIETARTSAVNGSLSIEPLFNLVRYDPTTSTSIGNINQNTYSWWRNKTKTSSASTYDAFLAEVVNLMNSCSLGTGGPIDLIIVDQTTYELLVFAIYQRYRQTQADNNFPFENTRMKKAVIVMDEKMPNVAANTLDTTTANGGSFLALNTKFFKVKYIKGRNFSMLEDENGKTFAKPIKGDSRLGHLAWMGNVCVNNRRKHGVMGSIARTLT